MSERSRHEPVLLQEALELLKCEPGQCVVDATVGCAGHGFEICKRLGEQGHYIGIDRDEEAVERAWTVLRSFPCRVDILHGDYARLDELVKSVGVDKVDAVIFDLGFSSEQVDCADRGFSLLREGPLDMRYSRSDPLTAADLLRSASQQEIAQILKEYGDERRARSIARAIVAQRRTQPITTTTQLRSLVHRCYRGVSRVGGIDCATRTFLALRIAVNRELESLREGLERAWTLLAPGGRQVMISFHSGEHRLIKQFLRRRLGQCICPPGMPACGCGAKVEGRLLVRRAITPSP